MKEKESIDELIKRMSKETEKSEGEITETYRRLWKELNKSLKREVAERNG